MGDTAFSLLMIFLVSWAIGHVFWSWVLRKSYQETVKEVAEAIVEKNFVFMKIERDPDSGYYFAYQAEDHSFLAHGETFEELQENFAKRFPNKAGLISEQNSSTLNISA